VDTRSQCLKCLKAQSSCLCHMNRPFNAGPIFVILIHPRERKSRSGTGTGRLTHLCISNSYLIEGFNFEEDPRVLRFLNDDSLMPVVLFPGENALDLTESTEPLKAIDSQGERVPVIFVIDGTWACARSLLTANPKLRSLPHICFTPQKESAFGFKKQPHPNCLSTLEAIHALITKFNVSGYFPTVPADAHDNLLEVFLEMVRVQTEFMHLASGRRLRRAHENRTIKN
jgi:DTW domain-containing protein YfiP